jgi:hypothetical protein
VCVCVRSCVHFILGDVVDVSFEQVRIVCALRLLGFCSVKQVATYAISSFTRESLTIRHLYTVHC